MNDTRRPYAEIYQLCPLLGRLDPDQLDKALARMLYAIKINGDDLNQYDSPYAAILAYLVSLEARTPAQTRT